MLPTTNLAPSGTKESPPDLTNIDTGFKSRIVLIAGVVAFYFIASISLVFLNKLVLSHAKYRLPAPLFVTWVQLVIALVFVYVLGAFRLMNVPQFEFKLETARKIAPVTILYVGMLATNNLCLIYVNMAFFQIARSLTIVFNIIFTVTILRSPVSTRTILCCCVVICGFLVGSRGEASLGEFSFVGTAFGVTASLFNALYSIYVKKALPVVDNNEWRLLGYNTTLAIIFLLPITAIAGELSIVSKSPHLTSGALWFALFLTGVAGFLINIAVFLQIKHTSSLTNNISGTAKAAVQTVVAVTVFQDAMTAMKWAGNILVIIGSALYSYVRLQEMSSSQQQQRR